MPSLTSGSDKATRRVLLVVVVTVVNGQRSGHDEFPEPGCGHRGPYPELTTHTCGKQTDKTHSIPTSLQDFIYTLHIYKP